jgi:hypothetical protein
MQEVEANLIQSKAIKNIPDGFFYVNQDNYCIVNKDSFPSDHRYLYSDSATSCIILVISGKDIYEDNITILTHLSRAMRFEYFFKYVCGNLVGPVKLWAQGGNPPQEEASLRSINILIKWLNSHNLGELEKGNSGEETSWFIEQASLSVGQGDPLKENRGTFGIDMTNRVVSNKGFDLTLKQRDPTGGIQTLFAVFGMKIWPTIWLWNAHKPFPKELVDQLVLKARDTAWVNILEMDHEEVLKKYSSTPQYEPEWFVPTLRQSAEFVKNYEI